MPLKVTFANDEITDYLRVDPGDDPGVIETMRAAAMAEAREYLNTNFTVDGVEHEAPATVKYWVLNRIAEKYENRGQARKPDYTTIQTYRVYPFRGD